MCPEPVLLCVQGDYLPSLGEERSTVSVRVSLVVYRYRVKNLHLKEIPGKNPAYRVYVLLLSISGRKSRIEEKNIMQFYASTRAIKNFIVLLCKFIFLHQANVIGTIHTCVCGGGFLCVRSYMFFRLHVNVHVFLCFVKMTENYHSRYLSFMHVQHMSYEVIY